MAKILNIRSVDEEVIRKFSGGAAVRGVTQAEYLRRLLNLREDVVTAYQLSKQEDWGAERGMEGVRQSLTDLQMWDVVA